jgi:hypothetical protein
MQGYLSASRVGVTSSGLTSNRKEEHLAVALFNRRELVRTDGRWLTLIDYQFPLKSVRADRGVGKIDLLGLCDDGTLAVIELKLAHNAEDRRIALVEGLIHAAVLQANIEVVANEVSAQRQRPIGPTRPKIMIVAAPEYWDDAAAIPPRPDLESLVDKLATATSIDIELFCLCDAKLVEFGLAGRPPRLLGHAYLSSLRPADRQHPPPPPVSQTAYLDGLLQTFWSYRRAIDKNMLDPRHVQGKDPPVFEQAHAHQNILLPKSANPETLKAIIDAIPARNRHRHFASMRSSQALAQSFFAGLAAVGRLSALEGVVSDDGYPAFFDAWAGHRMTLEHEVTALNEPRATSVDVLFTGPHRIAVEVKFTEGEFGRCSRPRLRPTDANFDRDHCDGTYAIQRQRTERCSLTQRGIRYWQFVPRLLTWSAEQDHRPCPVELTYQLVRNILAACVRDDGTLDVTTGHALVVYDARNPEFKAGWDSRCSMVVGHRCATLPPGPATCGMAKSVAPSDAVSRTGMASFRRAREIWHHGGAQLTPTPEAARASHVSPWHRAFCGKPTYLRSH